MSYNKYTWQTGETITADKLNHMEDGIAEGGGGGDAGYECVSSVETMFEGSLTTESFGSFSRAIFNADKSFNAESILVTINGTQYELPRLRDGWYFYGEEYQGNPSFENYPCAVSKYDDTSTAFYTPTVGTYQIKIEQPKETITTTDCFNKAVKYLNLTESNSVVLSGNAWMTAGATFPLPKDFILTESTVLMVVFDDKAEFIGNVQKGSTMSGSYYHMASLQMLTNDDNWFVSTRFYGEESTVEELPMHPTKIEFSTIDTSISGQGGRLTIIKIA